MTTAGEHAEKIIFNLSQYHNLPYEELMKHEKVLFLDIQKHLEKYANEKVSEYESRVINILNNYPDITVDDSVRIKNEIYDLLEKKESK